MPVVPVPVAAYPAAGSIIGSGMVFGEAGYFCRARATEAFRSLIFTGFGKKS